MNNKLRFDGRCKDSMYDLAKTIKNMFPKLHVYKIRSDVYWKDIYNNSFSDIQDKHVDAVEYHRKHLKLSGFVKRSIDGYVGKKVFKNGGFGIDYYQNRQLDFVKAYKFLKSQPNIFYNPVSIYVDRSMNLSIKTEHPGSAKMALCHFFKNPVGLTLLETDTFDNEFRNLFYSHSDSTHLIGDSDIEELYDILNFKYFTSENVYYKYEHCFEISEDHREIPGFVTDDNYTVDITENTVYVNSNALFRRNADTEMWEVCEL